MQIETGFKLPLITMAQNTQNTIHDKLQTNFDGIDFQNAIQDKFQTNFDGIDFQNAIQDKFQTNLHHGNILSTSTESRQGVAETLEVIMNTRLKILSGNPRVPAR